MVTRRLSPRRLWISCLINPYVDERAKGNQSWRAVYEAPDGRFFYLHTELSNRYVEDAGMEDALKTLDELAERQLWSKDDEIV